MALSSAEKPRIQAEDYSIEATVSPQTHTLAARAVVKFRALDDISIASFELHNALRVTKVTDAQGNALPTERVPQDPTVRVSLPASITQGPQPPRPTPTPSSISAAATHRPPCLVPAREPARRGGEARRAGEEVPPPRSAAVVGAGAETRAG